MKIRTLFSLVAVALLSQSCKDNDQTLKTTYLSLPETPYGYSTAENDYIPTLGRVLFYDKQLSLNNSVSCATCHKQENAFADNVQFSKGFENKLTLRNSMPIQNLTTGFFEDSFSNLFWDGREHNLNTMVMRPIVNHVEMGISDIDGLASKLEEIPYYKDLFLNAYGTDDVTSQGISIALSAFIRSINSINTKLDRHNAGQVEFTALESKGSKLFIETYDCNNCHRVETPKGYEQGGTFANIGLEEEYKDPGLGNVTNNPADDGKFKIPSLRNVILTAPYMHDGRFNTLDEVIEHYSGGIDDNPNLDGRLRTASGEPIAMEIPEEDKRAIVAFLSTLTDGDMISNPKFANPFKTK